MLWKSSNLANVYINNCHYNNTMSGILSRITINTTKTQTTPPLPKHPTASASATARLRLLTASGVSLLGVALLSHSHATTIAPQVSQVPQQFVIQAKKRLKALLGPQNYRALGRSLQVVSTLQNDRNIAAYSGCQKSSCGINDSLTIYDRKNNTVRVLLRQQGKVRVFTEKGKFSQAHYNKDLRQYVKNYRK